MDIKHKIVLGKSKTFFLFIPKTFNCSSEKLSDVNGEKNGGSIYQRLASKIIDVRNLATVSQKAEQDIFQSLNQSQISRNYFFQGYSCMPEKTIPTYIHILTFIKLIKGQ